MAFLRAISNRSRAQLAGRPRLFVPAVQTMLHRRFESSPSQPPGSSNYETPRNQDTAPKPTKEFYKQFGRPFAKVFLMAMLSYQVLYYCWEILRTEEEKEDKLKEVQALEEKVNEFKAQKAAKVEGAPLS